MSRRAPYYGRRYIGLRSYLLATGDENRRDEEAYRADTTEGLIVRVILILNYIRPACQVTHIERMTPAF